MKEEGEKTGRDSKESDIFLFLFIKNGKGYASHFTQSINSVKWWGEICNFQINECEILFDQNLGSDICNLGNLIRKIGSS